MFVAAIAALAITVFVAASSAAGPVTATLTTTPDPATVKVGSSVTFGVDGSSTGGDIQSWSLDYGDTSTAATGTTVPDSAQHQYNAVGTYTAELTVNDVNSASDTADATVTVGDVPTVSIAAPTSVSSTGATLNGSINPKNGATSYTFAWGTSPNTFTSGQVSDTVNAATTPQPVAKTIGSLSGKTTYYVQLCATNQFAAQPQCADTSFTTPAAPDATTTAASAVGQTAATLNGTVNPNGASTTYTFFWGTTSGNLLSNSGTSSPLTGTSPVNVFRSLTGLTTGKTYYFKLCATNSEGGPICGQELSFFTAKAPDVTTSAATSITSSGATLNGTVNPNNDATTYAYYWGTSSSNMPNATGGSLAAGTTDVSVPQTVALSPHTTYFFKLCATNGTGSTCGSTLSFFVPDAPSVTTNLVPSAIGQTTATISGSVNPNGAGGSYTFQWGTSSGNYNVGSTGTTFSSGTSTLNFSANITGLAGNTVYFFRLCATNTWGTSCGQEGQFQTFDAPTAIAGVATGVTTSAATLSGTVNPNGANVTSTFFKYGKTCSASDGWNAGCVQASANPNTSSGRSPVNETTTLGGLQTGSVFHYTLCATNGFGTRCDLSDHTFKTNAPPTASLKENKSSPGPLQVSFDGSGSFDPDGSIASWSLSYGDGTTDTGAGAPGSAIVHTYASAGPYNVVLTVTDDQGVSSSSPPLTVVVPSITIADAPAVTEGQVAAFAVTLSAVANHDVTVAYSTASGTAADGVDYTNTQGVLLIPAGTCGPGSSACLITVPTTQDTIYEGTETFTLNVASPTGAAIARVSATGTINDDDQPPALVIRDFTRLEGNDATKVSGNQTWALHGNVNVADGTRFNANQPFYIANNRYTFTGKSGNTLTGVTPAGTATDGTPAYQTAWLPAMVFEVDLCDPTVFDPKGQDPCPKPIAAGAPVTVNFATRDGITDTSSSPVKAGYDYFPACSQFDPRNNPLKLQCPDTLDQAVVIPAGATSGVIAEPNTALLIGNDTPQMGIDPKTHQPTQEFTRWFFMRVTSATNVGVIRKTEAVGRIIDDDAPNPPLVKGDSLTNVTSNSATIAATVNPVGKGTSVYIQFGKTTAYSSKVAAQSLPADNVDHGATFTLPNLQPNTTYHYQVVATHDINPGADYATGYGVDRTFTTTSPPPPPGPPPPPPPPPCCDITAIAPGAHTEYPKGIAVHSATLAATVEPNGADTRVWLEIGRTTAYGIKSDVVSVPAGPAKTVTLNFKISGLRANTLYHYRVIAVHDDSKTGTGQDQPFRTKKKMTVTLPKKPLAASITASGRLPVAFTCTGTALKTCRLDVVVELGATVIGSARVVLRPTPKPKPLVKYIKLTKKGLAQLRLKGRLRLTVEGSYATGDADEVLLVSKDLTALPAKAPARKK